MIKLFSVKVPPKCCAMPVDMSSDVRQIDTASWSALYIICMLRNVVDGLAVILGTETQRVASPSARACSVPVTYRHLAGLLANALSTALCSLAYVAGGAGLVDSEGAVASQRRIC